MKKIFFTPGPSQLYPTVHQYVKDAIKKDILSMSHRGERFQKLFGKTIKGLRELLEIPHEYHIVFLSSGTEAIERIIENTVEKKSFHFVQGSFAKKWYDIAGELHKTTEKYEVPMGQGFRNIPKISQDVELICFTQNETSSGVAVDPQSFYAMHHEYPNTLIAVDIVSSAPYIQLDYAQVDCVFFSVQKLFGLPAGLGVLIISPKALQKAKELEKKGIGIGSFHNFPTLVSNALKNQIPETPNVLGLYLLQHVVMDMLKKGIENIRNEQQKKAELVYAFFDNHPIYKPFVTETEDRSNTVIVITTDKKTKMIQGKLQKCGFIVGKGYGPYRDTQIRIAPFPAHEIEDVKNLLEAFSYV